MAFSPVEGFPERTGSCPVSFGHVDIEQQTASVLLPASLIHQIRGITGAQQVKAAWIAIADSIPPSAEASPSESPRQRIVIHKASQEIEVAQQTIQQQVPFEFATEVEARRRYWDFLAQHPECSVSGDF